jgi:hypothetical protein
VKAKVRYDRNALMSRIELLTALLTLEQLEALKEKVRAAVQAEANRVFALMSAAIIGRDSKPTGLGVRWSNLTNKYLLRKKLGHLGKKYKGLIYDGPSYFLLGGELKDAFNDLNDAEPESVFGPVTVTSKQTRAGRISALKPHQFRLIIDPYPAYAKSRKGYGSVEAMLFSPSRPDRALQKLVNRSSKKPKSYRPFVAPYLSWYIRTKLTEAARRALQ